MAELSSPAACRASAAEEVAGYRARRTREFPPQPLNADYDALRSPPSVRAAAGAGASTADYARPAVRGQGFWYGVVKRDRNKTESAALTEELLGASRLGGGVRSGSRGRAARWKLAAIAETSGVGADVIAAIWGVGDAVGTGSADPGDLGHRRSGVEGRRGGFRGAVIAALRILQSGRHHDRPDGGVLRRGDGATRQVMPRSTGRYAVKFHRRTGGRDIWRRTRGTALASTAE